MSDNLCLDPHSSKRVLIIEEKSEVHSEEYMNNKPAQDKELKLNQQLLDHQRPEYYPRPHRDEEEK
jgi:hypothetical protein